MPAKESSIQVTLAGYNVNGPLAFRAREIAKKRGLKENEVVIAALQEFLAEQESSPADDAQTKVTTQLPASLLKWAKKHAFENACALDDLVRELLQMEQYRCTMKRYTLKPKLKGGAR